MTKNVTEIDERILQIASKIVDQENKKELEILRQRTEREEAEKRKLKELQDKALATPIQFTFGEKVISLDVDSFEYEAINNYIEKSGKFIQIDNVLYSLDELVKVDKSKRINALNKAGFHENGQAKNAYELMLEEERQAEFEEYYGNQIVFTGDVAGNEEGRQEALEIASKWLKVDLTKDTKSLAVPTKQEGEDMI